jgi:hypothetical protein
MENKFPKGEMNQEGQKEEDGYQNIGIDFHFKSIFNLTTIRLILIYGKNRLFPPDFIII